MESIIDIRAQDIEEWASKYETPGKIPALLRRLINSTCSSVKKIEFPSDESISYSGWDGTLETGEGFQDYIPEGFSYWEISKNKKVMDKARSDIKKRSEKINKDPNKDIGELSFVFVTPRKWTNSTSKFDWAEQQRKLYGWKSVKIIDSDNLVEWIELSVVAQIYFANITGNSFRVNGITPSSQFWSNWNADCKPDFPKKLFDKVVAINEKVLLDFIKNCDSGLLQISCNSFDEGLAFLHCALSGNENILNRLIAINEKYILRDYVALDKEIIPVFNKNDIREEYGKSGGNSLAIQIIGANAHGNSQGLDNILIKLNPLTYINFVEILNDDKNFSRRFSFDETGSLYRKSGGSLTVLRRLLSKNKSLLPKWYSDNDIAKKLIPIMLAGFWKTGIKEDELVLSMLARDKDYSQLEADFNDLIQLEDSPVWRDGALRGVISKADTFQGIYSNFIAKDIETFFDIVSAILIKSNEKYHENNPQIRIIDDNNISDGLKHSITDTFLFLSVVGKNAIKDIVSFDIEYKISEIIKDLLSDLDEEKLDLHYQNFSIYAEASPDTFLLILEEQLIPNMALKEYIMKSKKGVISDHQIYPNLLWALEILAWSPRYFRKVTMILSELVPLKDDNIGNSPLETLFSLFRWYYPQTFAENEQKMSVFNELVDNYPDVAWGLIKNQISNIRTHFTPNSAPKWNESIPEIEIKSDPSMKFHSNFFEYCLEKGINWENHTKETLLDFCYFLNDYVGKRHNSRKKEIWNIITIWANRANDSDKVWLQENLRTKVSLKSKYAKQAFQALTPNDICLKNSWLFSKWYAPKSWDDFGKAINYRMLEYADTRKRNKAIREIYELGGISEILKYCKLIEETKKFGMVLSKVLPKDAIGELMETVFSESSYLSEEKFRKFIVGFTLNQNYIKEKYYICAFHNIREKISVEMQGLILTLFPIGKKVIEILNNNVDLDREYWKNFIVHEKYIQTNDIEYVAGKLLSFDRPYDAFQIAGLALSKDERFSHVRLLTLCEILKSIPQCNKIPSTFLSHEQHDIIKAIKTLESKIPQEQIAKLEWLFILIYKKFNEVPTNLLNEISIKPDLFCEIAKNLWEINNVIKLTPCIYTSEQRLEGWISDVKRQSISVQNEEICDYQIGVLLSNVPAKKNEDWPSIEVAKIIQKFENNKTMISAISTSIYNNRRDIINLTEDFGETESSEADEIEKRARNFDNTYPKVAEILRKLVKEVKRSAEYTKEMGLTIQQYD